MSIDASPSFLEGQLPITEPRLGQVTGKDQIMPGKTYLFRSASRRSPQELFVSQPITVLEGPQLSKLQRTFIKCRVDYPDEQLADDNDRSFPPQKKQTTIIVNLSDVGIMENGDFKPGTGIWLADPGKLPKES
jgi:hypothetical protein